MLMSLSMCVYCTGRRFDTLSHLSEWEGVSGLLTGTFYGTVYICR